MQIKNDSLNETLTKIDEMLGEKKIKEVARMDRFLKAELTRLKAVTNNTTMTATNDPQPPTTTTTIQQVSHPRLPTTTTMQRDLHLMP